MRRMDEDKMKSSLTQLIQKWLEEGHIGMPLTGDQVAECMAAAGMAVLRGIADTYEYLGQAGELKDED